MRPRLVAALRKFLLQLPPRYWAGCRCPGTHVARSAQFQARGLSGRVIRLRDYYDCIPRYGGVEGFPALRDFFGLSMKETRFVFDLSEYYGPIEYIGVDRVISHLDSVITTYQEPLCTSSSSVTGPPPPG